MTPVKFNLSFPLAVTLATVATATLSDTANAALFNLSYTSSAGTVTATLDGTLQPDNDTVLVTSISNPTFNGSPAPTPFFIGTITGYFSNPFGQPGVLSLSGAVFDFLSCQDSACDNAGFGFYPPDAITPGFPAELSFVSGSSYGEVFEPFVLANYSLTPAGPDPTPVPEPSAVIGLVGIGSAFLWGKRKKST